MPAATFALRAALALVVAVSLQVGVNYANDYSDGVRGTDAVRVGPVRLVGQQLAEPPAVKAAAWLAFGSAAGAGLILVLALAAWWLLPVGIVAVSAAWLYTGGPRPYGYSGLGEAVVFVFFGVVAVMGTTFVCGGGLSWLALVLSVPVGLLACALLVVNNLRDIPTDVVAGKRTLAVRIGPGHTRRLFSVCVVGPFVITTALGVVGLLCRQLAPGGVLLSLLSAPLAVEPLRLAWRGTGRQLVVALVATSRLQLAFGTLLTVGIAISRAWIR